MTWPAVDLEGFFAQIEHPRGIHLCGNPDWDFLLNLDIDILSFNAYNCGEIFVKYRDGIKRFLDKGGMFGWGLVPANHDEFSRNPRTASSIASKPCGGNWKRPVLICSSCLPKAFSCRRPVR